MHKIRPFIEKDYEDVCSLPRNATELFYMFPRATFPLSKKQLQTSIESRKESTVVDVDGTIAGFANFYKWEYGVSCSIGNFIINKEYRCKGLGRFLINEMIRIAKEKYKAKCIKVSCFNQNTEGLILYSRLGFIPYDFESRVDNNRNETILIHMKYELDIDVNNLKLNMFTINHVDSIQKLASKKVNSDKTNVPFPYPENGASDYQKIVEENWESGSSHEFVIQYDKIVIGMAGILYLNDNKTETQLGYWIDEGYRNKGIGSRIVQMLLDHLENELNLDCVNAHVLNSNIGSQKILEKNGFRIKNTFNLPNDHFKYPNELMKNYEYKKCGITNGGVDSAVIS